MRVHDRPEYTGATGAVATSTAWESIQTTLLSFKVRLIASPPTQGMTSALPTRAAGIPRRTATQSRAGRRGQRPYASRPRSKPHHRFPAGLRAPRLQTRPPRICRLTEPARPRLRGSQRRFKKHRRCLVLLGVMRARLQPRHTQATRQLAHCALMQRHAEPSGVHALQVSYA